MSNNKNTTFGFRDPAQISEMAWRLSQANPRVADIVTVAEQSSDYSQQQVNNAVLAVLAIGSLNGYTLSHVIETMRGQAELLENLVSAEFLRAPDT